MTLPLSTNQDQGFQIEKALFAFALDVEAAGEFDGVSKLVTGAGKLNAAYALSKAVRQRRPSVVINLGSAGSHRFKRGEVVCCTRFLQRDMDATGLGFKPYETPFSGEEPVLTYGAPFGNLPIGICGTGDNFETGHAATAAYDLVDMEAYALAFVAMRENLPFLCLKYISDGADGAAAEDWRVQVHHAAAAFAKLLFNAPEQKAG